jgi:type II secretory pathway component PulM
MISDNIQLRQQPSETLREKIQNFVADFKSCTTSFKKLEDAVKEALAQGRQEGYTDKEIGDMIRKELAAAGLYQIRRMVPLFRGQVPLPSTNLFDIHC